MLDEESKSYRSAALPPLADPNYVFNLSLMQPPQDSPHLDLRRWVDTKYASLMYSAGNKMPSHYKSLITQTNTHAIHVAESLRPYQPCYHLLLPGQTNRKKLSTPHHHDENKNRYIVHIPSPSIQTTKTEKKMRGKKEEKHAGFRMRSLFPTTCDER